MASLTYDPADVAAALRRRLPGLGARKLHKLLYLCQGRHLADLGTPLFSGSITAAEMGPVVGRLWKSEQTDGPATEGRPLDQAALNTIGVVVSRYGRLTGRDLEVLTHHQPPWNKARARGEAIGDRSPKIAPDDMADYFNSADDDDDEQEAEPGDEGLLKLLGGARDRLAGVARPDDMSRLRRRAAPPGVGH